MNDEITIDPVALEVARKRIEDILVEFRDCRISEIGRGNGLVVREKDGSDSYIIRLSTSAALEIGIKAYLAAVGP